VLKRSLTIAGHRTSLALEPEFWQALDEMSAARELSLASLVREIDDTHTSGNLTSAIRVAVLDWYRNGRATQP
jgi:predicted DNA-binding ribbon-helix-helix protein